MDTINKFLTIWLIGWYTILILIDGGAIYMLIRGAVECARFRDQKDVYTNTTCFINGYTFQVKTCTSCPDNGACTSYRCYDEQFNVIYSIFNGTNITSTIKSEDESNQAEHKDGSSRVCWYDKTSVTSVIWELQTLHLA